jgi:Glycosyltransferase family 87
MVALLAVMREIDPKLRRLGAFVVVVAAFVVLPGALLFGLGLSFAGPAPVGWYKAIDFHTPWQAARSFAAHHNPYVPPSALVPSGAQQSFIYPAPAAALLVPFGFLPYGVAAPIFVALLSVAVAGALWLFGVRDWRCYGAAFASPAVFTAISLGTLTPLLLLGVAATWRWRDRPLVAGAAVAVTAVLKVFMWPLLVWLWFTGRRRAAAAAIAIDVTASLAAWAWISFAGLGSYPDLLRRVSAINGPLGYGPLWRIGATNSLYLLVALGAAVLVAWVARRRGESTALGIAVAAALLASPVLWLHYLALLAAVTALRRPRLDPLWLLPLLLWVTPRQLTDGDVWRVLVAVAVIAATALLTPGRPLRRDMGALLPARAREARP